MAAPLWCHLTKFDLLTGLCCSAGASSTPEQLEHFCLIIRPTNGHPMGGMFLLLLLLFQPFQKGSPFG